MLGVVIAPFLVEEGAKGLWLPWRNGQPAKAGVGRDCNSACDQEAHAVEPAAYC